MADFLSKKARSRNMSLVKSRNTKLEAIFAEMLKEGSIKFRRNVASLPGKPDFASARNNIVIFVDSCFWHGCRYHGTIPKTNVSFWKKKLASNKDRDRAVNRQYKKMGWVVIRIWEHSITKSGDKVGRLLKALK